MKRLLTNISMILLGVMYLCSKPTIVGASSPNQKTDPASFRLMQSPNSGAIPSKTVKIQLHFTKESAIIQTVFGLDYKDLVGKTQPKKVIEIDSSLPASSGYFYPAYAGCSIKYDKEGSNLSLYSEPSALKHSITFKEGSRPSAQIKAEVIGDTLEFGKVYTSVYRGQTFRKLFDTVCGTAKINLADPPKQSTILKTPFLMTKEEVIQENHTSIFAYINILIQMQSTQQLLAQKNQEYLQALQRFQLEQQQLIMWIGFYGNEVEKNKQLKKDLELAKKCPD